MRYEMANVPSRLISVSNPTKAFGIFVKVVVGVMTRVLWSRRFEQIILAFIGGDAAFMNDSNFVA